MAAAKSGSGRSSDSAFWRFSLRFYALPGIAPACLELQENAGVDVNVLLYLLFVAAQGRMVTRDDVERIDALVKSWREQVVRPLRSVRKQLKNGMERIDDKESTRLRSDVKRIELDAERIEQQTLERLVPAATLGAPTSSRDTAARANIAAYGAFLNGLPGAAVETLLEVFAAS